MQIQISWLLKKKPTDLDLHCLLRQGMSCSAREGLRYDGKFVIQRLCNLIWASAATMFSEYKVSHGQAH